MTEIEARRIEFLTAGPVLRTWHGCIERVKAVSWGDRWLLCRHFACEVEELHNRIWQEQHMKPYQKDLIRSYEALTGLDVINKETITDDVSFWAVWDANKRWFENMVADVMTLDSRFSIHRPPPQIQAEKTSEMESTEASKGTQWEKRNG